MASEAALVADAGRWIGERVFGAVGRTLAERAPVVVRVIVPEAARVVAFRPLELAAVEGRPLAARWSVPAFLDTGLGCQLTELPIS